MRSAFLSHSTSDDRYVAEMKSFLRAAGYDEVFNDVSAIRPDEKFWPEIEKGIARCDTLFVVITSASNASEWVKREVEYARGLSKKVIPVWIEDCPIPPIFADRDVIDFRPRTRQERRFEISRIDKYAPAELIGREDETKLLNDAWEKVLRLEKGRPHVLTFVALGGEGKTSLVAKWAAELAHQDWPGCDAVFAWSFYRPGTREQVAASSDLFLKEALTFFGDDADRAFAASAAGAFEKGQRLARIVGQRRSLLILDGLEPLQYAPTSATPGQLKDQGINALLKGLAAAGHGLCVVTTRYSVPDLKAFWQTTAPEVELWRLSRAAGVHLLQSFGVKGSLLRNLPFQREQVNEFEKLVEDVQGHALTLNLLGTYLRDAHAGDIRKRDLVKLEEADAEEQGGHAFRVMEAYELEFEREGDKGQRALAVLRLLGLFDRPATSACLGALLQAPAIPGLTEPLVGLTEAQRNLAFKRLEDSRLLTVNRDAAGTLVSLDAHPLLREYFAVRLKKGAFWPSIFRRLLHRVFPRLSAVSPTWRVAHRRLYEHLCATTKEADQPTLEEFQPLYQAVAHGCQAGLQQKAHDDVHFKRIRRANEYYSLHKLGAFGSDLAAISSLFDKPWSQPSPRLKERDQAVLLGQAAFLLRALGRLTEALEPMRAALKLGVKQEDWNNAATRGSNLSELMLTLGKVAAAVGDAEQSVTSADRSGDAACKMGARTSHADALHQAGRRAEAETHFREAEQMQAEREPDHPLLYSMQGFQYCDLLLAASERAAWNVILESRTSVLDCASPLAFSKGLTSSNDPSAPGSKSGGGPPHSKTLRDVRERAAQTLKWEKGMRGAPLLDFALHHLTLGRAPLYAAILEQSAAFTPLQRSNDHAASTDEERRSDLKVVLQTTRHELDAAVDGLRRAATAHWIPAGLLTRAWCSFVEASFFAKATKDESAHKLGGDAQEAARLFSRAHEDLDEAWEIAERGPMKLFMADIHLYRARLFGSRNSEVGSANEAGQYPGNRRRPISLPRRNSSTTAATTAVTRNSRTPKPSSWRCER